MTSKNLAACRLFFVSLVLACVGQMLPGGPAHLLAQRSVELTLLSDSKSSALDHQQWMQAMSEVGADRVRIEVAVRPKPSVKESGSDNHLIVQVKGVIANGRVKFPGKSFTRTDAAGVRAFLNQLRQDGMKTTLAKKKAFSLTSQQLVDVHRQLSTTIDSRTKGVDSPSLIKDLLDAMPMPHQISEAAKVRLDPQNAVGVNLKGISAGTVLSILLRQHGLVFYPSPVQGRGVKLLIVPEDDAKEFWPPGWPVEGAPVTAFPKLFQRIPLQVNRVPLNSVLTAIEGRLDLPFLVDPGYTDKDRNPVDLTKTLVSYNKSKTSYSLALSKLLLQAKPRLRHELRQDEQGNRFLWISRQ